MTYAGILPPLIDSLQHERAPRPGGLLGQQVTVAGREEAPFIALDAEGHLHFLVAPRAENEERLHRFRRHVLSIGNRPWSVAGRPPQEYLDLTCNAPVNSPLRRPFMSFCEDVLLDLERGGTSDEAVYRTCLRWHRFWEEEDVESVSAPWLLGLLGELVVLRHLVTAHGPGTLRAWTGPEGEDHDFQAGADVAVEVKTTTRLPAVIECHIEQLDPGLFRRLYLACVLATPSNNGVSLPDLVAQLEDLLKDDETLDTFLGKLAKAGYRRHRDETYRGHTYETADPILHLVDEAFPRITFGSFRQPLDARIKEVRYRLELSDVPRLPLTDQRVVEAFAALAR